MPLVYPQINVAKLGVTAVSVGTVTASGPTIVFANSNGVTFGMSENTVTASISVTGGAGGAALSAGTQSGNTGTVVFADSNGLTFGMSGSSQITGAYSQSTHSHSTSPGAIAAGTQTATSGTIVFSNAGNVSFGLSNSSVVTATASFNQSVAPGGIAAGTQTATSGTVVLLDGNNFTFGMTNSSQITASFSQSTHSHSTALAGIAAGGSTQTDGVVVLSNSNNVSFGFNGSTITATATFAQTAQPAVNALGVSNTGTTAGNTGTFSGVSFVFGASGGITASQSTTNATGPHSIWFSVPAGASATGNLGGIAVNAASTETNGTVVFSNSNNVSFGFNGSTITATATFAQTNQTIGLYGVSNTVGQSSSTTVDARSLSVEGAGIVSVGYSNGSMVISAVAAGAGDGVNILAAGTQTANTTGTVAFLNSNGISFGMSNSSQITASYTVPTQTNQTIGLYGVSNTTGQSSSTTVDARSLSVEGAGIVSVGYSAGSLIISASAAGAADGVNILAAGTQTANTTGTVAFLNSNGVTWGMTNSSQITASYSQSTAPAGIAGSAASTVTNGTVVFANANGVSFGLNGSTMTASYTVPTQTTQPAVNAIGVSNTGTTAGNTGTFSGVSFVFGASGNITASQSTTNATGPHSIWFSVPAVSAVSGIAVNAASTLTNGTAVLSNSNNVSFGFNGSTITATATFAQTNQSAIKGFGVSNTGTTAGSTGMFTGIDWVLAASGQVTASASTTNATGPHTAWISVPTHALAVNAAGSVSVGTVVLSNSNNVSFGLNGSTVTATATFAQTTQPAVNALGVSNTGTTAGNTGTFSGVSFVFGASGNITASQSTTNATGPHTIWFSVPTAGGGIAAADSVSTLTNGTLVFANSNGVSFGLNGSTMTASIPLNATKSRFHWFPDGAISSSQQAQSSLSVFCFEVDQDISFSRCEVPFQLSLASSAAAATGNILISSGLVIYSRAASTLNPIIGSLGTTTHTWASNTSNFSNLTGGVFASFATGTALTPGEYFCGFFMRTTNNSSIGTATTQLANTISLLIGSSYTALNFRAIGQATNSSTNIDRVGLISSLLTNTAQTLQLSQMTMTGTMYARANLHLLLRNIE